MSETGELPKEAPTPRRVEEAAQTFTLGEGLPPVPAKLVSHIQKGEFIDMAELLRDNIKAERRRSRGAAPAAV